MRYSTVFQLATTLSHFFLGRHSVQATTSPNLRGKPFHENIQAPLDVDLVVQSIADYLWFDLIRSHYTSDILYLTKWYRCEIKKRNQVGRAQHMSESSQTTCHKLTRCNVSLLLNFGRGNCVDGIHTHTHTHTQINNKRLYF